MAPSHVRGAVRLHVMQLTGENAGQPLSCEITHPGCGTRNGVGPRVRQVKPRKLGEMVLYL